MVHLEATNVFPNQEFTALDRTASGFRGRKLSNQLTFAHGGQLYRRSIDGS